MWIRGKTTIALQARNDPAQLRALIAIVGVILAALDGFVISIGHQYFERVG
jgi:hypothetical protein